MLILAYFLENFDFREEQIDYIEDVEVCYHPIEIKFKFIGERLLFFELKIMEIERNIFKR